MRSDMRTQQCAHHLDSKSLVTRIHSELTEEQKQTIKAEFEKNVQELGKSEQVLRTQEQNVETQLLQMDSVPLMHDIACRKCWQSRRRIGWPT